MGPVSVLFRGTTDTRAGRGDPELEAAPLRYLTAPKSDTDAPDTSPPSGASVDLGQCDRRQTRHHSPPEGADIKTVGGCRHPTPRASNIMVSSGQSYLITNKKAGTACDLSGQDQKSVVGFTAQKSDNQKVRFHFPFSHCLRGAS